MWSFTWRNIKKYDGGIKSSDLREHEFNIKLLRIQFTGVLEKCKRGIDRYVTTNRSIAWLIGILPGNEFLFQLLENWLRVCYDELSIFWWGSCRYDRFQVTLLIAFPTSRGVLCVMTISASCTVAARTSIAIECLPEKANKSILVVGNAQSICSHVA